jgi:hypothetical protein
MLKLRVPSAAALLREREAGRDLTARQCRALESGGDSPLGSGTGAGRGTAGPFFQSDLFSRCLFEGQINSAIGT